MLQLSQVTFFFVLTAGMHGVVHVQSTFVTRHPQLRTEIFLYWAKFCCQYAIADSN